MPSTETTKQRYQRLLNIGKQIRKDSKHVIKSPTKIKDLYCLENKLIIKIKIKKRSET